MIQVGNIIEPNMIKLNSFRYKIYKKNILMI